jgi:SSS family solute:Na+ symporter
MIALDYVVLIVYFSAMIGIGIWSMLLVKKQEDFFLGSRTFGKVFQTFAAFGSGTGSYDPVTVGRTTFTSGLSGIWSVLLWLFVTPFYWISAVWYRRMRHITLGDWFVERYHSKGLGAAFMLFAIAFYMVYLALGFTAISKVGAPLVGVERVTLLGFEMPIEHVLVYVCALVVLVYGVLGGLRAAYWTDVIQGFFIIILSVLLIPAGLSALVAKEAAQQNVDPATMSVMDGFRVMHQQVPQEYFEIIKSPRGGEFPLYYIVAITLLNMVAVVVHPHMAVTGGGTARTENSARVGLVTGNFLKRLCTIGWCITILIVLAYMAGNLEIAGDPDRVWGVAAREILGPYRLGLVGLMLACLMAALMSSASAYMLIVSALVVRNLYAAYIDPHASERTYVLLGRIISALVIIGGVAVSLYYLNVFEQLKIAWEMPILFAAPFLVGMFWRRATKWAAWSAFAFSALAFFIVPAALPLALHNLASDQRFSGTNEIVTTIVSRRAAESDVARREAEIILWNEGNTAVRKKYRQCPPPLRIGDPLRETYTTGGKPIYWKNLVWFDHDRQAREVVDGQDNFIPVEAEYQDHVLEEISRREEGNTLVIRQRYKCTLEGRGSFKLDFLIFDLLGVDAVKLSSPALETLRLPARIVLPFVVVILVSLVTPAVSKEQLDRFYVKMRTPVQPDAEADRRELEKSYQDPSRFDHRRLLSRGGLEVQKPRPADVAGVVVCFVICFLLIWLTVWLAKLGS